MKTEFSLECIHCEAYNIRYGIISEGKIICYNCFKERIKIGGKKVKWKK